MKFQGKLPLPDDFKLIMDLVDGGIGNGRRSSSPRGLSLKGCLRSLLLHHMSQLVRQKSFSLPGFGRVFSCAEHDIPPHCEGPGIYATSELGRAGIGVDSYRCEVMPESWFEEGARRLRERRPATREIPYFGCDTIVYLSRIGLRRLRFTAEVRRRSIEGQARPLLHHLVGHAVRLVLERVVDLSDYELRLDERGRRPARYGRRGRRRPPLCFQDLCEIGHGPGLYPIVAQPKRTQTLPKCDPA